MSSLHTALSGSRRLLWAAALGFTQAACSAALPPAPLTEADAVSESKAAGEARTFAPQAFAAAEKYRAEARWLHEDGHPEEASVAGEQAIAGYQHAFALARALKAHEREEAARRAQMEAEKTAAELARLLGEVSRDADTYELRARVHLDTEAVKDETQLSPERKQARFLAARQLSSEAGLLCLSASLVDERTKGLAEASEVVRVLDTEISQGSTKDDLFPRAANARARCLEHLTQARRTQVRIAPESSASDALLTALTQSGKLFAYRDDRGIVVNLAAPLTGTGELTPTSQEALVMLGGTAKAHPEYPVLVVAHTAKNGETKQAERLLSAVTSALQSNGAGAMATRSVQNAQPVVSNRVHGAAEKNERVEIIFVTTGR
jgi:hypothetical protein